MGTSAGPNLAGIGRGGASNLVLEMDAHDAKSYPGEPTSNIFYNPNNWTGSDWTSSSGTIANNAAEGPNGGSAGSITATNSDPYIYSGAVHSVATGSLTFSCWVKGVGSSVGKSGDMRINFGPGTATGSDPSYVQYTLTDQWQRVSILATVTGAGTIQVGLEPPNSAAVGDVVYLADAQLEQKGYATPFVREGNGGTGTYNARPASVNLMIHGNVGTGQTFSDSSPSKHTITTVGNTTHSSESKFSGGSIAFDGTVNDYLGVADSTDWEFSNQPFTIDFWGKNNSTTASRGIISIASSSQSNYENILVYTASSATTLVLYSSSGGTSWDIASGAAMGAFGSDWTHYAIVRAAVDGNITLYNNGTLQTTVSTSATLRAVDTFRIGQRVSESNSASCYLDEIRITKGTALWTAAFTPPTRRNLSAPVVDRSGNDNGGNFATADMTDVATYRVGEVIRPIASATWDFDGTDDAISIKTDAFDLKCFTVAIKQGGVHAGPFPAVPGQVNVGMNIGTGGFNGIIMGSWTGTMDDETLSLWGYNSTNPSGSSATYIKDVIEVGWHIFTFNWNGSDYDIWVDGTKRITFARGGGSGHSGLLSGVTAIYPGRSLGWSTDYFEGNIGFFRAYDKSLSDQQIIENFHAKRNSLNIANWGNRDIVQNGLDLWLDAGVAASYPESGSTWYDLTANNYNGTIANATYDVYGDGSLSFDGSGDTVDVGPISTAGDHSNCTISIWMNKAAQVSTYGNLYDCNYGITDYNKGPRMEVDVAGSIIRVYMGSDGGNYVSISFGSLSNDEWYNLVLTVTPNGSSQDLKSYTDGALVSSSTSSSAYVWDGDVADLYLGVGFTAGRHFTGKIAAFELYNRVLSANEIAQNFTVQRQRFGK